jgi:hypothetical protein
LEIGQLSNKGVKTIKHSIFFFIGKRLFVASQAIQNTSPDDNSSAVTQHNGGCLLLGQGWSHG